MQELLNKITQTANSALSSGQAANDSTSPGTINSTKSSGLPSGLLGGAAAGGVMALLLSSKSSRRMAKKVAKYGGSAVLGGLAYKAYSNWQQNKAVGQTMPVPEAEVVSPPQLSQGLELHPSPTIDALAITAMIAAAKSDGRIDASENRKLFEAIQGAELTDGQKDALFELMGRDIAVGDLASQIEHEDHKAQVYLAAYMAIEVDEAAEREFLNELAAALQLSGSFAAYLEQQADRGIA